jgi:hypothetical protein
MRINVYDTYSKSRNGRIIHFDVLLPEGGTKEIALKFAREFLKEIGEPEEMLKQERCNFCHSQEAPADIKDFIEQSGHFILQMEGCPKHY